MTSYSHIHPDFRHVMGLSAEKRVKFLDCPRWIGYEKATRLIELMQGLMEKPKRPRMPNLLIVGDSNNGKTTIVQRFKDVCGKGYVDDDANPVKPVIVAESPPSADEKGLYISILREFWAPHRASDSKAKLRYQVVELCRDCQVKILVLDELHSLLTGTPVKQREVMNAIKLLCNELMIPIVGVGTRDAVRVLHIDPQHASRFDVYPLTNWKLDKSFQCLLADFEKVLPLKQPSRLHDPQLAVLLHSISGGNLGDLHRLLVECTIEAITKEKEFIDVEIIKGKSWLRPTSGIREVEL